jgi:hypothetical protein
MCPFRLHTALIALTSINILNNSSQNLKIIAKDLMVMQSWLGPVDVSNGIYPTADVIIIPP